MAREKSPAFQFYPKDFLSDHRVLAMTCEARGAYILLLCCCWLARGLPADIDEIRRISGWHPRKGVRIAADAQWREVWKLLAPCFVPDPCNKDQIIHPRIEAERQKQADFREKRRLAGQAGGKQKASKRVANNVAKASSSSSNKISHSNNQLISNVSVSSTDGGMSKEHSLSELRSNGNGHEPKRPAARGSAKEPADPNVKVFLKWFQSEYKTKRHGADYLVKWEADGAIVKRMLHATALADLQNMARILLSDKTDEPFIAESDRGIGVLALKFNWLSDRYAQWRAARGANGREKSR